MQKLQCIIMKITRHNKTPTHMHGIELLKALYYWYVRKPCGSPELFMLIQFFYIVLYIGNRLSAFFFAAVGNSILTRIYRLKNTTDMYLMTTPLILYMIIAVYQNSHVQCMSVRPPKNSLGSMFTYIFRTQSGFKFQWLLKMRSFWGRPKGHSALWKTLSKNLAW